MQLPFKGTVLPYVASVTSGGRLWYQVIYEGQTAYVMAAWARIMTDKEYQGISTPCPHPHRRLLRPPHRGLRT